MIESELLAAVRYSEENGHWGMITWVEWMHVWGKLDEYYLISDRLQNALTANGKGHQ